MFGANFKRTTPRIHKNLSKTSLINAVIIKLRERGLRVTRSGNSIKIYNKKIGVMPDGSPKYQKGNLEYIYQVENSLARKGVTFDTGFDFNKQYREWSLD